MFTTKDNNNTNHPVYLFQIVNSTIQEIYFYTDDKRNLYTKYGKGFNINHFNSQVLIIFRKKSPKHDKYPNYTDRMIRMNSSFRFK